jgi:SAM-dependent methyltransferase
VSPSDLAGRRPVVYVGVGGGLEALELAYFRRFPGGVIAVDPVAEMREAAERNLQEAARLNPWFRPEFVSILDGEADRLPVPDASADLVAQNCLFNVFTDDDLDVALAEVHRVLAPGGRFSTSDPITTVPLPEALRMDDTLRARCISGCQHYEGYIAILESAGFGQIIVRSRVPYRLLTRHTFPEVMMPILLESLEVLAVKTRSPSGHAQVFTGRCAIYLGKDTSIRDGFAFAAGTPVPVSDDTATALAEDPDFLVTEPTYHARSAGCC